jgi:hypothetical protein
VSLTLPKPTGARPHVFSLALERGVV